MSKIEIQTAARTHDLVETIRANRRTGIPTLVFGPPGVGKSQQVHQAADGDPVIDVRLSMLDPVDLRGLPMVKEGTVAWARPDFLPDAGKGILLFDELNTAPVAVQNAALQLILDRRCGPHRLGDGWYIVACGNRATHKAHVNPLSAPLRNRFAILDYQPSVQRWTRWALEHHIHPYVTAFLNFSPDHLTSDPADEYTNFASPRSWERVSHCIISGVDDVETITSLVGRGSAVAFDAYRTEISEMPDIERLLDGRVEWKPDPAKLSVTYAVAMALAGRLLKPDLTEPAPEIVERSSAIAAKMPPEVTCLFFIACYHGPAPLRESMMLSEGLRTFAEEHRGLIQRFGGSFESLGKARKRK